MNEDGAMAALEGAERARGAGDGPAACVGRDDLRRAGSVRMARAAASVGRDGPAGRAEGLRAARQAFLALVPGGFRSEGFDHLVRRDREAARDALGAEVPMARVAGGSDQCRAALRALLSTRLLSHFEIARLGSILTGADGDGFLRAAARFALEPSAGTIGHLERILAAHNAASWPVATVLPFLWQPESHMFLRPASTVAFAHAIGDPFAHAYRTALDIATYERLLDLAGTVAVAIADLEPRDNIDIQGFVRIVARGRDGADEAGAPVGPVAGLAAGWQA